MPSKSTHVKGLRQRGRTRFKCYDAAMTRVMLTAVVTVLLSGVVPAAAEPPALVRARTLYNAGNYDGAIAAAGEVQASEWLDAARLVVARSHLDRYRRTSQADDLTAGRQALITVSNAALMPRDRIDLLIGLGQVQYFSGEYGAASSLFDNALAQGFLLNRQDRLLLLDWWANAADRAAQARVGDRHASFERLRQRMEDEVRRDAENPVANYWLVVAARGAGDVQGAWDEAVAAWVRSRLIEGGAADLRADLDRLMTEAIIPERARLQKEADAAQTLRDQWEAIKQQSN
jgi:hypothetical protein